ncbi:hypothetical protein DFS34DRAFT_566036, partial [Phlyctochytrium arcticum]
DAQRWHERLGHPSKLAMRKIHTHTTDGPLFSTAALEDPTFTCSGCVHGKAHATPFLSSTRQPVRPFEYVSSDIDELPSPTHDGFCYFVSFID